MGTSLRDFTLFHSHRIGLTSDGRPIPIVGGGRVTGRAAGVDVGLLNMQTECVTGNTPASAGATGLRRELAARAIHDAPEG
jgi:hypothetical protein